MLSKASRSKNTSIVFRLTSCAVILCFLISSTAQASSISSYPAFQNDNFYTQINISPSVGFVEFQNWVRSPDGHIAPFIVYIQDAHGNPEVQRNISQIIDYFKKQFSIKKVFVEGAVEPLNPKYLKFLPNDSGGNRKLLDRLTDLGELSGAELSLMNNLSDSGLQFIGMDNRALYHENFKIFRKVIAQEGNSRKFIREQQISLDKKASNLLEGNFLAMFRMYLYLDDPKQDWMKSLSDLERITGQDITGKLYDPEFQIKFPNLARVFYLKNEKVSESELAINEWALIKRKFNLPQSLSNEIEQNVFGSSGRREFKGNLRHLLENLYSGYAEEGFKFESYPHFSGFSGSKILRSELQSTEFQHEFESYLEMQFKKSAKNQSQLSLLKEAGYLKLLQKLLLLELTRNEFETLKEIIKNKPMPFPDMGKTVFFKALEFYGHAVKREQSFIKAVSENLDPSKENGAILISGGFHTEGMMRQFNSGQLSYVVIRPHIEHSDKKNYRNSMMRGYRKTGKASGLVLALLAQSHPSLSELIGNDASEERITFIKEEAVRVEEQAKLGDISANKNLEISEAKSLGSKGGDQNSSSFLDRIGSSIRQQFQDLSAWYQSMKGKIIKALPIPREIAPGRAFPNLYKLKKDSISTIPVYGADGRTKEVAVETVIEEAGRGVFSNYRFFMVRDELVVRENDRKQLWEKEEGSLLRIARHEMNNWIHAILAISEIILDKSERNDEVQFYLEDALAAAKQQNEKYQEWFTSKHVSLQEFMLKTTELMDKLKILVRMSERWGTENESLVSDSWDNLEKFVALIEKSRGASLADLIQITTRLYQKHTNGTQIDINMPDEGVEVQIPGFALIAMIGNLIRNAIRYKAKHISVTVQLNEKDHITSISVWNDGEPIKREHLSKITKERFSTRKYNEGEEAGVGLYVTKRILELEGGAISVSSGMKEGTQFVLSLPYADAASLGGRSREQTPPEGYDVRFQKDGSPTFSSRALISKQDQMSIVGMAYHELSFWIQNDLQGGASVIKGFEKNPSLKEYFDADGERFVNIYKRIREKEEQFKALLREANMYLDLSVSGEYSPQEIEELLSIKENHINANVFFLKMWSLLIMLRRLTNYAEKMLVLSRDFHNPDDPMFKHVQYFLEVISSRKESLLQLTSLLNPSELHKNEEPRQVDLNEIVQLTEKIYEEKSNHVIIEIESSDGPLPVHISTLGMIFILGNMVRNAVRSKRESGMDQITVKMKSFYDDSDGKTKLFISNNGPHFKKEILPILFQKGASSDKASRADAGMGLALSKQLIQKYGGEITAENLPERGVIFKISFPPTARPSAEASSLGKEKLSAIAVALGGNALIADNGPLKDDRSDSAQFHNMKEMLRKVLKLYEPGKGLLITHGNGPQVGDLWLAYEKMVENGDVEEVPALASLVAETQTKIFQDYIERAYDEIKQEEDLNLPELVFNPTRMVVDPNDEAFQNPIKPIGPYYSLEQAQVLSTEKHWIFAQVRDKGWRRVVSSPRPLAVHPEDLSEIRKALKDGKIVIAAGGGGIPVAYGEEGSLHEMEGVIDKDRSTALLAESLNLSRLLIVTGVPRVKVAYKQSNEKELIRPSLEILRQYFESGEFPQGSMGPKVEALIYFLESGGREAGITNSDNIDTIFDKDSISGTVVGAYKRGAFISEGRSLGAVIEVADKTTGSILDPKDLSIWPHELRQYLLNFEIGKSSGQDKDADALTAITRYLISNGIPLSELPRQTVSVILTDNFWKKRSEVRMELFESLKRGDKIIPVIDQNSTQKGRLDLARKIKESAHGKKLVISPAVQRNHVLQKTLNQEGFALLWFGELQSLNLDEEQFSQISFNENELEGRELNRKMLFAAFRVISQLPVHQRKSAYELLGLEYNSESRRWIIGLSVVQKLEEVYRTMQSQKLTAMAA